jgi:two-component system LytT family response regulator
MRAYLLDDEPLAVDRLQRILGETGRVEIVGASTSSSSAVDEIRRLQPDVLFLDIEMPGLSGFDVLARLGAPQPLVIFTTAFDQYALEAFKVNSIDYLVKPIERADLARALAKLERVLRPGEPRDDVTAVLDRMRAMLNRAEPDSVSRLASRTGERVEFVDVAGVSYFYAKDKLTFAVTAARHHALDLSIAELEQRLPSRRWLRIHRSTLICVDAVKELHSWFGGRPLVRLKDGTELPVARDRVGEVKAKLGT